MDLITSLHELCLEIEKLPASEQQTKISILASALRSRIAELEEAARVDRRGIEATMSIIEDGNIRKENAELKQHIAELNMPEDVREILLEACRSARSEADGLAITYQAYDKRLRYIEESKQYSRAIDWLQKGAK